MSDISPSLAHDRTVSIPEKLDIINWQQTTINNSKDTDSNSNAILEVTNNELQAEDSQSDQSQQSQEDTNKQEKSEQSLQHSIKQIISIIQDQVPSEIDISNLKECSDSERQEPEGNQIGNKNSQISPLAANLLASFFPHNKKIGFQQYLKSSKPTSLSPILQPADQTGLLKLFIEVAKQEDEQLKEGIDKQTFKNQKKTRQQHSDEKRRSIDTLSEEIIYKRRKVSQEESKTIFNQHSKQVPSIQRKEQQWSSSKKIKKKETGEEEQEQEEIFSPIKGERIESASKEGDSLVLRLTSESSPTNSLEKRIAKFDFSRRTDKSASLKELKLKQLLNSKIFSPLNSLQDQQRLKQSQSTDKKENEVSCQVKSCAPIEEEKSNQKSLREKFQELKDRFKIVKQTFKSSIVLE